MNVVEQELKDLGDLKLYKGNVLVLLWNDEGTPFPFMLPGYWLGMSD